MKRVVPLMLALLSVAPGADVYRPPTEEPPETIGTSFRLAAYLSTSLALGEWKNHPVDAERTMFGPLVGGELEAAWSWERLFLGAAGRFHVYDTDEIIGLGEGSGRIETAHATSYSALASTGYYLASGRVRPWIGLGLGVEWLIADETINGIEFDFDNVFRPALLLSPALGLEFDTGPDFSALLKVGYDFSLNQVEGYGDYHGHGQDLVLSAGLGLNL